MTCSYYPSGDPGPRGFDGEFSLYSFLSLVRCVIVDLGSKILNPDQPVYTEVNLPLPGKGTLFLF